jgi:hypothetical protein
MKRPTRRGTWQEGDIALLRAALGTVPLVGSILAELVGLIIPDQRVERLDAYLKLLDELFDGQGELLRQRFCDPERIDLFEEGAVQSLRAVSDERKVYIASIVANGLSGNESDRLQAKRLLRLLSQIDDDQIIVLASKLRKHESDIAFLERHSAILEPIIINEASTQDEIEAEALQKLARAELLRLGLLKSNFLLSRKGQLPEFDPTTGMLRASSTSLTPLGRMLLVQIGLATPGEA